MYFGRQQLLNKFANGLKVRLLPLIAFIDAFGLYRNIYRSLIGYYIIVASLSAQERQRAVNVLLLTLRPYSSIAAEVIEAIGLLLSALDASIEVEVNGTKSLLCVFIFIYIGDMPQQQANSSMLSQ